MSKLSNGAKQGIIEEVLSGNGVSIRSIARKYNIGASTLHKWIKKYRENDIIEAKISNVNYDCRLTTIKIADHL
jgi:transposase-like protein